MPSNTILVVGPTIIGDGVRRCLADCEIVVVDDMEKAAAYLRQGPPQAMLIAGDTPGLSTQSLDDLRALAPASARKRRKPSR